MEAVVVHDEAIVVGEVQFKSCSEAMFLNHKPCDEDKLPMVIPSEVGKVEKTEKSSQNSVGKEKQAPSREEIEYSLQWNASQIRILQAQIGLGNSMKDNASLKLLNDSSLVRNVAEMNHRSISLDADARLIPPRHDTPSTQLRVSPSWFDMSMVKARWRAFNVVVRENTNLVGAARGVVILFGRGQQMRIDKHQEFHEVFLDGQISKPGCLFALWFQDLLLVDVTPFSLSLESVGGCDKYVHMAAYASAILAHFVKSVESDVLAKLLDERIIDIRHASWFPP